MDINIFGSTGFIGRKTLEVIDELNQKENFENIKISGITGHNNCELLEIQIRKYKPKYCVISNEFSNELKIKISDTSTVVINENEISNLASQTVDVSVIAIVGIAGLLPCYHSIKNSKKVLIANKESIVVAGKILLEEAKNNTKIIPIDSEHSAIFQILEQSKISEVNKIILTASGGPFYGKKIDELKNVTISEVLNHPTWKMGAKITVDSATLMNKGFEIIEAYNLFPKIEVDAVIQRQSIIHSIVEYIDGNLFAHMSPNDMKFPIQYGLTNPNRFNTNNNKLSIDKIKNLTFDNIDEETFKCLALAKQTYKMPTSALTVLNSANEASVNNFLIENKFFRYPKNHRKRIK